MNDEEDNEEVIDLDGLTDVVYDRRHDGGYDVPNNFHFPDREQVVVDPELSHEEEGSAEELLAFCTRTCEIEDVQSVLVWH